MSNLIDKIVGYTADEWAIQFFKFDHLPAHLQALSQPFAEFAVSLLEKLSESPERTEVIRKLLEAKDCAVRAHVFDLAKYAPKG